MFNVAPVDGTDTRQEEDTRGGGKEKKITGCSAKRPRWQTQTNRIAIFNRVTLTSDLFRHLHVTQMSMLDFRFFVFALAACTNTEVRRTEGM